MQSPNEDVWKLPLKSLRETTHHLKMTLNSEAAARKQMGSHFFQENYQNFSIEIVDNWPYRGHLLNYFSKYAKKKFRAPPSAIHRFTHSPYYLNFKQFDWTRIRSTWDENPSLEREFIKEITSHINNRNYFTICNCPFHIFREPFGVFYGVRGTI